MERYIAKLIQSRSVYVIHSVQLASILLKNDYEPELLHDFDFEPFSYLVGFVLVNNNHWTCFFVDRAFSTVIYLDPFGAKENIVNRCFDNWVNFCLAKKGLDEIEWKLLTIKNQTKQKQADGWNCGVYCCEYLKRLINSNDLKFSNSKAALKVLRDQMYRLLKE